jgi:hypothetical protein
LKGGGLFLAEMGGRGNIAGMISVLISPILRSHGS